MKIFLIFNYSRKFKNVKQIISFNLQNYIILRK